MAKPIRAAFGQIDLPINTAKPRLMHIDMNSCFASIEQQANPLLRDRPIVVSPYTSPRGIIVAPSVEAKALGIKLGMRNQEAKEICPNLVILPPDPDKYRDAHRRFKEILLSYTDQVYPRSIDEAIVDFRGTLDSRKLLDIGAEIKKRIYEEIGVAIRVSVGIGPNRWLAKLAAGLTKPDGLEQIDEHNLEDVYSRVELTDLPGINVRYEARLKANGIHTPLELMNTPMITLKKRVFGSVNGYYWHLRMRGWEVDDIEWQRKSIGHSYALKKKTEDTES